MCVGMGETYAHVCSRMLTYEQVYVEMCVGMGETLASAAQVCLLLRAC